MMIWLIPLSLLGFLTVWVWLLCRTLRREEPYHWLILLAVLPPVGVLVYGAYALLEKDAVPGMEGALFRWRLRAQARHLAKALQDADTPANHLELARTLVALGLWAEALTHLEPMLAADEENLLAQYNAGLALLGVGRPAQAAAHLAFVVEQDARYDLDRARLRLAETLLQLERREEALAIFARLIAAVPRAEIACSSYLALRGTELEAAAREALQRVASSYGTGLSASLPPADRMWLARARKMLQGR